MIDSFLYLDLNRIKTEIESSFYVYASQRRRYINFPEYLLELLRVPIWSTFCKEYTTEKARNRGSSYKVHRHGMKNLITLGKYDY